MDEVYSILNDKTIARVHHVIGLSDTLNRLWALSYEIARILGGHFMEIKMCSPPDYIVSVTYIQMELLPFSCATLRIEDLLGLSSSRMLYRFKACAHFSRYCRGIL